jgi:RNA polymerase sigma-70 factor (ECF subfamily)
MIRRTTDERAWIERAKAGDQAAFEALYRLYERPIYTYILRLMGDADDAADLVQETFLKAYRALPRFGEQQRAQNLSAWLHRIAGNACLDVLRRRQRARWLPWVEAKHDHLLLGSPCDEPERAALSREARDAVRRTLDRIGRRHRLGLILLEYDGLSCDEIGAAMGLSRSATKSMLCRARAELRRRYAEAAAGPEPAVAGARR